MNFIHLGRIKKDETIITRGDKVNFLFIVRKGKIQKLGLNLKVKGYHNTGDYFGQIQVLYRKHWEMTLKAAEDTELWCIEKKQLQKVLAQIQLEFKEFYKN